MPQTSVSLPTSKTTLTSLLSSLSNLPTTTTTTATTTATSANLSAHTKPPLLTLHALFPTLLLPALDLLDRRLITRFILRHDAPLPTEEVEDADTNPNALESGRQDTRDRVVYYVKSNTNTNRDGRSRYTRTGDVVGIRYEVRTQAWSCTCAAFAFSAYNNDSAFSTSTPAGYGDYGGFFVGVTEEEDEDEEMLDGPVTGEEGGWQWGGLMAEENGEEVPLCKHLLACVLVERWGLVGELVEERVLGREEMGGWGGWMGWLRGNDQWVL